MLIPDQWNSYLYNGQFSAIWTIIVHSWWDKKPENDPLFLGKTSAFYLLDFYQAFM